MSADAMPLTVMAVAFVLVVTVSIINDGHWRKLLENERELTARLISLWEDSRVTEEHMGKALCRSEQAPHGLIPWKMCLLCKSLNYSGHFYGGHTCKRDGRKVDLTDTCDDWCGHKTTASEANDERR